jgi:WD40 repeat protein
MTIMTASLGKLSKGNPVRYFVICFALILVVVVVACSPGTPIEVTRVVQVVTEIATSEPITQEVETTATLTAIPPTTIPTITPSPTLLPSSSPTTTPTLIPTIAPLLVNTGELPFGSFQYPVIGISADGSLLAVAAGGFEDRLYIFDMNTQTIRWQQENESGGQTGYSLLAFSPDRRYLAAWDNGLSMFVWDTENGEVVYRIEFDRNAEFWATSISFSPDSQLLALSSLNNSVMIYSMSTGDLVDTLPSPNIVSYPPTDGGDHFLKPGNFFGDYFEVKFVPNHTNLLAISVFPKPFTEGEGIIGGVYFWDLEAQSLENIIPGEGGFSTVISPNGQLLVALIGEQLVGWNIQNNYEAFTVEKIESNEYPISITDNGFFVTLSSTAGLKIWDFSGELIARLHPDEPLLDVVFMPDGRLLMTRLSEESPIEIWKLNK